MIYCEYITVSSEEIKTKVITLVNIDSGAKDNAMIDIRDKQIILAREISIKYEYQKNWDKM